MERERAERADRIIVFAGLCAAASISLIALSIILSPGREPRFHGVEHMSIFARPSARLAERLARADAEPAENFSATAFPSPGAGSAAAPVSAPAVVGSLRESPDRVIEGWRVQDVIDGRALLLGPGGVRWARPGVDLGEAGIVLRMQIDRSGVAVLTDKGRIVRAP